MSAFYPILTRNSRLSSDDKLLLYKTTIITGFTYAAPIWGYAVHTYIKKL